MASYIGKVQIGNSTPVLVGSTLYGICSTTAGTAAKTVVSTDNNSGKFINNNYDQLLQGTTIHVKFTQGNTVTSGITLQVGTVNTAQPVDGKFLCDSGTVISFTLDENEHWVVNDNIDTNTEYVFAGNTPYNAISNKALAESSVGDAAYKEVISSLNGNTSSTALPTAEAVAAYVQEQTGGLSGLTGAMHFRGSVSAVPSATATTTFDTYISGDVILGPGDKEYVYVKAATAADSQWIELGDESDYALKSSTATVISSVSITATIPSLETETITATQITSVSTGSAANLQTTTYTIPNVTTAGTATTASVTAGVLTLFIGTNTQLGTDITLQGVSSFTANTPTTFTTTTVSVNSVTAWSAGTAATITTAGTTVVVPDSNPTP